MTVKLIILLICAMKFLAVSLSQPPKKIVNTAPRSVRSVASADIESLRAFKQLGFDDQHSSGRLRQTDIAIHHVYHDPNKAQEQYKPYSSSNYGSSSSKGHVSNSFHSSPYFSGYQGQQQQHGAGDISSMWPNNVNNEMSNVDYQHQSQSHPNDILSNMGVELPPSVILGKSLFLVSLTIYVAVFKLNIYVYNNKVKTNRSNKNVVPSVLY